MPIYFLVHEAGFYHQQLAPALAASWRLRSFGLLGLFLGPAVLACLLALWREWADGRK